MSNPIDNHVQVLILQHPKESRNVLSTVPLLQGALKNCEVRIGLSWKNLKHALKNDEAENENWAVLYLGTKIKSQSIFSNYKNERVIVVDRKEKLIDFKRGSIKGVIILDGNWKQSKSMWWRNSWLLKLNRILLNPSIPSSYSKLRKEPRFECLSTIEAISLVLKQTDKSGDLIKANLDKVLLDFINTK